MGVRIIGISGSLRQGSFNTSLLRAAAEVAPEGATIEVRTIHGIPLYDADVENGPGVPEVVAKLKDEVAAADGVLLVTPEYNNSIPGRVQECDRLDVPTRLGYRARFSRKACRAHGRIAWALRDDALAGGVVAGGSHAWDAAMVRRAAARVRGPQDV